MSEELKPCPFCAGTRIDDNDAGCVNCGAFANSIEAWNTRPIEDALNAKIDTLLTEPDYVGGVQFWIRKHSDVTRDFANTALSMAERLDEKDAEIGELKRVNEVLHQLIKTAEQRGVKKSNAELVEKAFIAGAESVDERVTYDYALSRWMSSDMKKDLETDAL